MAECKGASFAAFRASESTVPRLVEAFQSFLLDRNIGGATEATMACYRFQLGPFVRWCEERRLDLPVLTVHDVRSFFAARQKGSQNALHASVIRVRTFFRWCSKEGICEDLTATIRTPKLEQKILPALEVPQLRAMLALCTGNSFIARRNEALLRLLLDAGLRVTEALMLTTDRLSIEQARALVDGKGQKQRYIFFGAKTQRALLRYLPMRKTLALATDIFFIDDDGSPMQRRNAHRIIASLGRRAGIEGVRVSPHTLRHTSALLFLRRGGDALALQRLLGHTTLTMTRRYVHESVDDLEAAHRRSSPGDLV